MDRSSKRWTYRIPFLVVLLAGAAGLTGGALAVSAAPDPAPGTQLTPRPDAAGTSAPPSHVQPSTRSSTTSTGAPRKTTRSEAAPLTESDTKGAPARTGGTPARSAVRNGVLPVLGPATRVVASGRASRDDTLLLGAALALGTLTLASLALLGLARRLRQEVAPR